MSRTASSERPSSTSSSIESSLKPILSRIGKHGSRTDRRARGTAGSRSPSRRGSLASLGSSTQRRKSRLTGQELDRRQRDEVALAEEEVELGRRSAAGRPCRRTGSGGRRRCSSRYSSIFGRWRFEWTSSTSRRRASRTAPRARLETSCSGVSRWIRRGRWRRARPARGERWPTSSSARVRERGRLMRGQAGHRY